MLTFIRSVGSGIRGVTFGGGLEDTPPPPPSAVEHEVHPPQIGSESSCLLE